MRIYIDLDRLAVVEGPGVGAEVTEMTFKRATQPLFQVQFGRNDPDTGVWTPESIGGTDVLVFGLKEVDKYDGEFVVSTDDFTEVGDFYEGSPSFNTVELNALLNSPDADEDNDVPSIILMGEFSWGVDGDPPTKTKTFSALVQNAVVNGDEGDPTSASPTTRAVEVKDDDESRTSTIVPVDDGELQFAIAALQIWTFEFLLHVSSASITPGWMGGLQFPASPSSATWYLDWYDEDTDTWHTSDRISGSNVAQVVAFPVSARIIIKGSIVNGVNAGTVSLKWAQAVSNGAPTLIDAGSSMIALRTT